MPDSPAHSPAFGGKVVESEPLASAGVSGKRLCSLTSEYEVQFKVKMILAMSTPARNDPRSMFFRRVDIVEHLFGDLIYIDLSGPY